jgi:hypothetical protein
VKPDAQFIPTIAIFPDIAYQEILGSGTGSEGVKYAIRELTEMNLICLKK